MSPVIGLMLPFAAGVALSPIPIAAVILMILSLHPGIGGRMFVAGWALGLLIAVVVLSQVVGLLGLATDGRGAIVRLGPRRCALVVFALERASAGRASAHDHDAPAWVSGLDRLPADRAFAMGVVQAALDPRKLVIIAAVAMLFSAAQLSLVESVIAAVAFCVIGSLGVALAAARVTPSGIGWPCTARGCAGTPHRGQHDHPGGDAADPGGAAGRAGPRRVMSGA